MVRDEIGERIGERNDGIGERIGERKDVKMRMK